MYLNIQSFSHAYWNQRVSCCDIIFFLQDCVFIVAVICCQCTDYKANVCNIIFVQ